MSSVVDVFRNKQRFPLLQLMLALQGAERASRRSSTTQVSTQLREMRRQIAGDVRAIAVSADRGRRVMISLCPYEVILRHRYLQPASSQR